MPPMFRMVLTMLVSSLTQDRLTAIHSHAFYAICINVLSVNRFPWNGQERGPPFYIHTFSPTLLNSSTQVPA